MIKVQVYFVDKSTAEYLCDKFETGGMVAVLLHTKDRSVVIPWAQIKEIHFIEVDND